MKINVTDNLLSQNGLVALPSIVILSLIMLTIGIAMSFSSFTQNTISFNSEITQRSYFVAESGIKDAMMKITRNKNYNIDYALQINADEAIVTFDTSIPNQTKVTSTSTINNHTKKIEATLDVTSSGKVTILSWHELSI
ncbi:hypothetical protein K0B03_04375 [Patescibacteria group bacterium]|nr:hypothetical protein [Patescibacteria group bacterium]